MFLFIYRMPLWLIGVICIISGLVWAKLKEAVTVGNSATNGFGSVFSKKSAKTKDWIWYLINLILFAIVVTAIGFVTLRRGNGTQALILEPFISFEMAKVQPEVYRTMLMNIVLFVPFGISITQILPRRIPRSLNFAITVIIGTIFSVTIEWLQYKFCLGTTEVDDIICNSLGAVLGATTVFYPFLLEKLRKQRFYDKRLAKYLSITFSLTLVFWGLLSAFTSHEAYFSFGHPISVTLHILGGFSPFVAALLTDESQHSFNEVIGIYKRINKDRIKLFISFAIAEICVFGLASMQFNLSIPWYLIPIILVMSIFIYGGNEEIGWRGTMQPILEEHFPFPIATIITGIVWSVWHIPLWFVPGAFQQNSPFIFFMLLGIMLSFWLDAIYKKTESILFCSILHGLTNTLLSVFVIRINILWVLGLIGLTVYSIHISYNQYNN